MLCEGLGEIVWLDQLKRCRLKYGAGSQGIDVGDCCDLLHYM